MSYNYQIFIPGGNDTALIFGIEENPNTRKTINDAIMSLFSNIEQVGFISIDNEIARLVMAGGEFCGNATRAAAWYYLNGQPGTITVKVSGIEKPLSAGVTENHEAWAQMPVDDDINSISEIESGCFLVNLEGISHIVVTPSCQINTGFDENLKTRAYDLLKKHNLLKFPAAGVIYLQQTPAFTRIHPFVRVPAIDTMIYETACGSGTIAAGLVHAYLSSSSIRQSFIQPSGYSISAIVTIDGSKVVEAKISGCVNTDYIVHTLRSCK